MLFYTQLFTSKRGPLAKIWLAAHWERKLTKAHVFECNLEDTIQDIISPKMKIGLRTSGHLLLGVVRIYSRKTKYLFADCSNALVQMKVAFRPGQTDLPVEGLEATVTAITLVEDFTSFDAQLPLLRDTSNTDVVDQYSLNQCRSEEITLKEDFGKDSLTLADFGGESNSHQNSLLDMSFHSLAQQGDAFGDEDRPYDLLGFPDVDSRDPVEGETSTLNETSLLINEEAFALEPVTTTPNSEKKRGRRKRKLVVDEIKELSNRSINEQLCDFSDLLAPLDMAPPTVQLMQWKESGGAHKLFAQTCSSVAAPQIKELFAQSIFPLKCFVREEVEEMRQGKHEVQQGLSALTSKSICVMDSSVDTENVNNTEPIVLYELNNNLHEDYSSHPQDQNTLDFLYPELPSEDSMFVHPSHMEQETESTALHTQVLLNTHSVGLQLSPTFSFSVKSMLDSQDFEERRISRRAHRLLNSLKSSGETTFSLEALCEGGSRSQAATTFFCLLVLKKEQALHLQQSAAYQDILATPGPKFYDL
ncbi:unnamed protein product [Pleuronectes platessa]|uniref:RAD21 cohesin complex component like 1 n=1 Tax=Pleuronectes platessa TaxID=8262 RepID=A0A9N7VR24_PLEPL|nr:unnamed protein product [Pleuronectes platessa]